MSSFQTCFHKLSIMFFYHVLSYLTYLLFWTWMTCRWGAQTKVRLLSEGIRSCQGSQTFPDSMGWDKNWKSTELNPVEPTFPSMLLIGQEASVVVSISFLYVLIIQIVSSSLPLSLSLLPLSLGCFAIGGYWRDLKLFPRLCIALRRLGLGLDSFPFVFRCLS